MPLAVVQKETADDTMNKYSKFQSYKEEIAHVGLRQNFGDIISYVLQKSQDHSL